MVNQVRRGPVPGRPAARRSPTALERFAGREVRFFLPADRRATDAALAAGRTLAEVAAGLAAAGGAAVAGRRAWPTSPSRRPAGGAGGGAARPDEPVEVSAPGARP